MEIHSERKKKLSLPLLFKIIKDTVWGFIDDSVMRLSASLAYATLFSIIPFLSLLVTVGVFFHMDLANQLYVQLQPIVGPEITGALRSIIENAENTDSSRSAAIVSLGISIFGATTIFAEIQSSLNTIWGIKAVPKKSWLKFIKNRILSFSIILVFAFILLITFTITSIIGELSKKFMVNYPEIAGSLVQVVGIIINIGVTAIIFTLIFKILPDAKIKSRDVFIGAIVTHITATGRSMGNLILYRDCKRRNRLRSSSIHGRFRYVDLLFFHHHIYRRRVHQSMGKRNGW